MGLVRDKDVGVPGQGSPASDPVYDLVSVLYHALDGAKVYQRYCEDAELAGDSDLAGFFRDTVAGNQQRAERAKLLLMRRLGSESGKDKVDRSSKDSFPASDAPAH